MLLLIWFWLAGVTKGLLRIFCIYSSLINVYCRTLPPLPKKTPQHQGRKNLNTAHKCYQLDVFNHCVEYRNFSLNWAKFKPFLHMALTGCKVLLVRPAFPPKNIRVNIGSSWEKKGKRENPWDLMLIKCFPREFMAQPWRRCLLSKCAVTWLWADRQHLRCEER